MYKKLIYIIVLLLFMYDQHAFAQQDGGIAGEFLRWGIGSRAMGLGRAYTALADDATASYWNAAGLADDPVAYGIDPGDFLNPQRLKFALTYFRLFEETNFFALSSVYNYSRKACWGLALLCLSTEGIERWDSEFDVTPGEVFSANKLAVLFSWSRRFGYWKTLDIGSTIKYVHQSFSSNNDEGKSALGVDVGFRWRPLPDQFYWGLNIQNLTQMELGADKIPLSIKTGWGYYAISKQNFKLLFALDLERIGSKKSIISHLNGGLEIQLGNLVSLRAGKSQNEYNFGIGIIKFPKVNGFSFDLAHSVHEDRLGHGIRSSLLWDGNSPDYQQWYKEAISDSNWGKGRSKGLLQKIIDQYPDPIIVAQCYARFGDYEYENEKFDKASKYYNRVFQIAKSIDSSKRSSIYHEHYHYKNSKARVFRPHINHLIASIKLVMDKKIPWPELTKIHDSYCDFLDESIKQEWWFSYCRTYIFNKINPTMSKADSCCKLYRDQYRFLIDSPQTAANLKILFQLDLAACLLDTCFKRKIDTFNFLVKTYKKQAVIPQTTAKFDIPDDSLAIDSMQSIVNKFDISFNKVDVPGSILQYIIKAAIRNEKNWLRSKEIYQFYDDWETTNVTKDSMFKYYGAVIYHKNAEAYNDSDCWNWAEKRYKFLIDSTKFADSSKVIFKLNRAICQLNSSEDTTAEKSLRAMAMAVPEICAKSDPLGVFVFNDQCIIDDAQYSLGEYYICKKDTNNAILEFAKIPFLNPELDLADPSTKRIKEILAPLKQDENPLGIADLEIDSSEYDITLSDASDIEVDRIGNIYVSETGRRAIKIFNFYGTDTTSIRKNSLTLPTGMAFVSGDLYIIDYNSNILHLWDSKPQIRDWLPFNEKYENKIRDIYSSGNHLYLLDLNDKIIFLKEGINIHPRQIIVDNLIFPVSLAIDESVGDIYVADWGYQGIVRFDSEGTYVEKFNDLGEYCWPIFLRIERDILNINNKTLYAIYWNLRSNAKELVIHNINQDSDFRIKIKLNSTSMAIALNLLDNEFPLLVLEGGNNSRIKRIKIID